jgi:O-succinylbenzoic acid--CoA ligase
VEVRIEGATGEVAVRGPMLLRAYRDGRDPKTGDGWFATRDAGEVDAEGHIAIHGRLDDAIVTGGEKVWPAPVEAAIAAMEQVAEVAIVGRADPEWGERVVAVVVARDPAHPPTLESLRAAVKAVLPGYAAPRELVLREALPRNAGGKVQRGLLL